MQSVSILEELKKKGMQCTGCGACRNICPVNAIQMQEDMYGFLYPSIDSFSMHICDAYRFSSRYTPQTTPPRSKISFANTVNAPPEELSILVLLSA